MVPLISSGNKTFSIEVRQSRRTAFWNIIPISLLGPTTSAFLTNRSPPDFSIRPEINLNNVDLPQPLGPTSEINEPRGIVKLASSTAITFSPNCFPSALP